MFNFIVRTTKHKETDKLPFVQIEVVSLCHEKGSNDSFGVAANSTLVAIGFRNPAALDLNLGVSMIFETFASLFLMLPRQTTARTVQ